MEASEGSFFKKVEGGGGGTRRGFSKEGDPLLERNFAWNRRAHSLTSVLQGVEGGCFIPKCNQHPEIQDVVRNRRAVPRAERLDKIGSSTVV